MYGSKFHKCSDQVPMPAVGVGILQYNEGNMLSGFPKVIYAHGGLLIESDGSASWESASSERSLPS